MTLGVLTRLRPENLRQIYKNEKFEKHYKRILKELKKIKKLKKNEDTYKYGIRPISTKI